MSSLQPQTALLERLSPSSRIVERREVSRSSGSTGWTLLVRSPWRRLFVKLDVQGAEPQVLAGAEGLWPRIQGLQVELALLPLYEGETDWRSMVDDLADRGLRAPSLGPGLFRAASWRARCRWTACSSSPEGARRWRRGGGRPAWPGVAPSPRFRCRSTAPAGRSSPASWSSRCSSASSGCRSSGSGSCSPLWCVYFFRDPERVTPDDPALVTEPGGRGRPGHGPAAAAARAGARRAAAALRQRLPQRLRRACEPDAGRRPGRAQGLPSGQIPQCRAGQGVGRERAAVLPDPHGRRPAKSASSRSPGSSRGASSASSTRAPLLGPGERVGLIRFGSRCDVYLPAGVVPMVIAGQRAVAGETVIAAPVGPRRASAWGARADVATRPPPAPPGAGPLLHLVPNLFTILGLCAGLTGLRYGLDGRFELAVALIIAAAVLDGLDGRSARLLKITSQARRRARQPGRLRQFRGGAGDRRLSLDPEPAARDRLGDRDPLRDLLRAAPRPLQQRARRPGQASLDGSISSPASRPRRRRGCS